MAISLRRLLPTGSSTLPALIASDRCWKRRCHFRGLLGLARGGVCLAIAVTNDPVCSYHTFSPLPREGRGSRGRIESSLDKLDPRTRASPLPRRFVSVALSLTQPSPAGPVGVTHHRVLSCSDFPRPHTRRGRGRRPHHTNIVPHRCRCRRGKSTTPHAPSPCCLRTCAVSCTHGL